MSLVTLLNLKQKTGKLLHELDGKQRLVVLQNTMVSLSECGDQVPILTEDKVDLEELRIVHQLARSSETIGPFAATYFEDRGSWARYLVRNTPTATLDDFMVAEEKQLWLKYMGMCNFNSHLMGQIVHSVCLTAEMLFHKHGEPYMMMAPAVAAHAYASALTGKSPKDALFLGAFSPYSVMGIWGIKNHFIPETELTIVDLEGLMAMMTADMYGIPFVTADAMDTLMESMSVDLILTNFLTPALRISYDPTEWQLERECLFAEMFRLLRRGGRIALVEPPLIDSSNDRDVVLADIAEDRKAIIDGLTAEGFTEIDIRVARKYELYYHADFFVRKGLTPGTVHTDLETGTRRFWVITAVKPC